MGLLSLVSYLEYVVRRIVAFTLILLFALVPVGQTARFAGEAFSLGVGGRSLALGGAVIAGPFDASAPYFNPAGMNFLSGRYLMAMHAETFGSLLNHDYLAYVDARPRENSLVQAIGFYLYYLGGGGIKITDFDNVRNRPVVVREESHGDFLFVAAMSGKVGQALHLGLAAKIIYRDLGTETGYGLTMDAGMVYEVRSYLNLGLMVSDVTTGFIRYSGATFDSGANSESIFPTVKPGFMVVMNRGELIGSFSASGDIKFENLKTTAQYWSGATSLDTHYGWEVGFRGTVFGRAGFDIGRFTTGGGVEVRKLTLDFAYLHHADLDETYRVSAGYRF